MRRGHEPEEFTGAREASVERGPSALVRSRSGECRAQSQKERARDRSREPRKVYEIRGRSYRLRNSEITTMLELGKFRAIAEEDLSEFAYGKDKTRMRPDVENLIRQGLVQAKAVPHEEMGLRRLLSLTRPGHRFLTRKRFADNDQTIYFGFVKPREADHDADLYRIYQNVADKIERGGGRNLRVVLDFELKKRLYQDLFKSDPDQPSAERRDVAEQHGLHMVRGKIPIPDVRIEYDTPEGERARVDIELATCHYSGGNLVEKVRAGFSIYARASDVSNLRRVMDQRELTAEILSL